MTLQDINCFITLAETLNFTKTAEILFISQPAVTRHINALESELGFQLLDRSVRRKVILTEAGKIYYLGLKKCNDTYLATLEKIHSKNNQSPLILNLLRGTRFPDAFVYATDCYMKEHPNFRHFMNFIDADSLGRALERGEVLLCPKEYLPSYKKYRSMKITPTPIRVYMIASQNHPAFLDHSENPSLLDNTALFLSKDLPEQIREAYLNYLEEANLHPSEIMYLDSVDSVLLFLRSGRCFSFCNEWGLEYQTTELATIKTSLTTDYYAVWDPELMVNPFCESYLKALLSAK